MIRVYTPWVAANQKKYVCEALDDNLLTFHGRFVERFERQVAAYVGARHAVAVANGSVALYALYDCLGLRRKVVVTAALTYAATVAQLLLLDNAVLLVDCDDRLQLDADALDRVLWGRGVAAVVVPPLYADLPDMRRVALACRDHNVLLVEDAAEGFGCRRDGRHAGTFGRGGTFSFFANKVVTCGEGGAVVTDDDALAAALRKYVNQGVAGRFWHDSVGTNFRMTNLQAAVGSAQMEEVGEIVARKRALAAAYRADLHPAFGRVVPAAESAEWMPVFRLPPGRHYGEFERWMAARGVETRPAFTPVHRMPAFAGRVAVPHGAPAAEAVPDRHFLLPASPGLTRREVDVVVAAANAFAFA